MIIFLALTFLLCELGGMNNYIYQGNLAILYVGTFVGILVGKKVHWSLGLLFSYVNLLALVYIALPMQFYLGQPNLEISVIMGLQILNMHSLLYIYMCVLPFLLLKESGIKNIGAGIYILGVINFLVLFVKIATGHLPYWLLNNPAMDVAFISCCIPLFLASIEKGMNWQKYLLFVGIPVIVCFATKTSTGVMGAGVALASYYWAKHGFKPIYALAGSGFAFVAAMLGYTMQGHILFDGSGRYHIWEESLKFWKAQHHALAAPHIPREIGSGLGSFFMYGPTLQLQEAMGQSRNGQDVFFWMHNDWGQVLFQTGFIGLVLTVAVFAIGVFKARKFPAIFASLITYGCISFIQMPLEHYVFAVFGLYLLFRAFSASEKGSSKPADKQNI